MFKFKSEKIKNASTMPHVYYGLHFDVGVAEYKEVDGSKRIFIDEQCAKIMDATFPGKPVYVGHVDKVELERIQETADGYVSESFFNKADGKHWAKFVVVSDKGHEAIRNGWKLSNAYFVKEKGAGGQWHGVDYNYEVTKAEYEHLAIVPNPRYDESIILTPEQFKQYNEQKEAELKRLINSKGDKAMLKFFKREKVENSVDLESTLVELPKSKVEVPLSKLVNDMDEVILNKGKPVLVNSTDLVKVGNDEMTVADLVTKFENACKKNEEHEKAKKENEEEKEENEDEEKEENEDEEEMKNKKKNKKKNKEDEKEENEEDEEKASNSDDFFSKVKNAHKNGTATQKVVETSTDALARGKSRYGSK